MTSGEDIQVSYYSAILAKALKEGDGDTFSYVYDLIPSDEQAKAAKLQADKLFDLSLASICNRIALLESKEAKSLCVPLSEFKALSDLKTTGMPLALSDQSQRCSDGSEKQAEWKVTDLRSPLESEHGAENNRKIKKKRKPKTNGIDENNLQNASPGIAPQKGNMASESVDGKPNKSQNYQRKRLRETNSVGNHVLQNGIESSNTIHLNDDVTKPSRNCIEEKAQRKVNEGLQQQQEKTIGQDRYKMFNHSNEEARSLITPKNVKTFGSTDSMTQPGDIEKQRLDDESKNNFFDEQSMNSIVENCGETQDLLINKKKSKKSKLPLRKKDKKKNKKQKKDEKKKVSEQPESTVHDSGDAAKLMASEDHIISVKAKETKDGETNECTEQSHKKNSNQQIVGDGCPLIDTGVSRSRSSMPSTRNDQLYFPQQNGVSIRENEPQWAVEHLNNVEKLHENPLKNPPATYASKLKSALNNAGRASSGEEKSSPSLNKVAPCFSESSPTGDQHNSIFSDISDSLVATTDIVKNFNPNSLKLLSDSSTVEEELVFMTDELENILVCENETSYIASDEPSASLTNTERLVATNSRKVKFFDKKTLTSTMKTTLSRKETNTTAMFKDSRSHFQGNKKTVKPVVSRVLNVKLSPPGEILQELENDWGLIFFTSDAVGNSTDNPLGAFLKRNDQELNFFNDELVFKPANPKDALATEPVESHDLKTIELQFPPMEMRIKDDTLTDWNDPGSFDILSASETLMKEWKLASNQVTYYAD